MRNPRVEPDPLVMILTPVFNGEEYIRECIESVLAQTYSNWEYLIVNNCSTDRTLEIAQEYAKRDPRIHIHDNDSFLQRMQNINNAFRRTSSQSKYCKMVLADDWIFPECLGKMVSLAEKYASVGIVGAYGLAGKRVLWHGLPYPSPFVSGRQLAHQTLLGGPYVLGSPTSLLFRSDCVFSRDPFYDESNPHGDYFTCLALLEECDFGFVHQVLSYTRERPDSGTSFSRHLNTHLLEDLTALLQYGPLYLNDRELTDLLKQWKRDYYVFLGESVFYLREKGFWQYHSNRLRELGYPLSLGLLVWGMLLAFRYTLFHPDRKLPILRDAWAQAWRRLWGK
jgi:glycosyltransferase involved in cell wall biosynthesis